MFEVSRTIDERDGMAAATPGSSKDHPVSPCGTCSVRAFGICRAFSAAGSGGASLFPDVRTKQTSDPSEAA